MIKIAVFFAVLAVAAAAPHGTFTSGLENHAVVVAHHEPAVAPVHTIAIAPKSVPVDLRPAALQVIQQTVGVELPAVDSAFGVHYPIVDGQFGAYPVVDSPLGGVQYRFLNSQPEVHYPILNSQSGVHYPIVNSHSGVHIVNSQSAVHYPFAVQVGH